MKLVLSNSDVAHYWANRVQSNGKTSNGSFYFEDDTIYSYGSHFPIAKHLNSDTVLFTKDKYSNTTSKHISKAWSAITHKKIVNVPNLKNSIEGNFKDWLKEIESTSLKLGRAKKPEIYISEINVLLNEVNEYCLALDLKLPKEFKKVEKHITTGAIGDISKDLVSAEKKRKAKEEKQKLEREKENREKEKVKIEDWKNFELYSLYTYYTEFSFLRYNYENQRIETSKGINIPVELGKRFFDFINLVIDKGGCKDNCNYKILEYSVNEINNKFIRVGCHTIEMSEIKSIAEKLGFI